MIEKNFSSATGKIAFHFKDVHLMLDPGKRLDFPLPLTSLDAQALARKFKREGGEWDNTDIIFFYEYLANL